VEKKKSSSSRRRRRRRTRSREKQEQSDIIISEKGERKESGKREHAFRPSTQISLSWKVEFPQILYFLRCKIS
jgi:hypothetical protein